MSFIKILLSVPDSSQTVTDLLSIDATNNVYSENGLRNLIERVLQGEQLAYAKVSTNPVQASGTVTFSSLVADDTVTINGVVFTAKASPSGTNQFGLGANDTAAAANLAAKINASALAGIVNVVTATSALGVVTLTAVQPGLAGNAVTIAISAHGSVSGSGRLTSGTDGTQAAVNYGVAS
jgi:phage tail sheath gpL-like